GENRQHQNYVSPPALHHPLPLSAAAITIGLFRSYHICRGVLGRWSLLLGQIWRFQLATNTLTERGMRRFYAGERYTTAVSPASRWLSL
ncbi:MAG: hypothetical protein VX223_13675, partial [Myxococcota bacterium]|nr:hypothetical protein [Myxococcota bacterium]